LTTDGKNAIEEAITKNEEAYKNLTDAQKIALDQLTNAYDRSRGVYKESSQDEKAIEYKDLKEIASSINLAKEAYSKRAIKE
jgi:hypothetical protein